MEDSPYPRKPILFLLPSALLFMIVGCAELPPTLLSSNSPITDENQLFDATLIGTWAPSTEQDPHLVLTITRDVNVPKRYILSVSDPKDPDDKTKLMFGLRLFRVGSSKFVEIAETVPRDIPTDERLTVAGKPLRTAYFLWRVIRTQNAVQVLGFENTKIMEQLPAAEMVPAVPSGRNDRIINCSADRLRQFLLKNERHMTREAGAFKRYNPAVSKADCVQDPNTTHRNPRWTTTRRV